MSQKTFFFILIIAAVLLFTGLSAKSETISSGLDQSVFQNCINSLSKAEDYLKNKNFEKAYLELQGAQSVIYLATNAYRQERESTISYIGKALKASKGKKQKKALTYTAKAIHAAEKVVH